MIYLFEVSIRPQGEETLKSVYLFYKPYETPLELRKSIDNILAKIREKRESPIQERIYLANELNVFFDKIKILLLGIPFEPKKLEGTGIQVLVFRIPHLLKDYETNVLAIADSEDSPIAVKRIIRGILSANKEKINELIQLSFDKQPGELPDEVSDIYNELDFKVSEVLRSKIRKIRWAEKAKLSAAMLGLFLGLTTLFILTGLVLWFRNMDLLTLDKDRAILFGFLIILATGFSTGFFTGWSKWVKVSAPLVSIIGTATLSATLFRANIESAYNNLGLQSWAFGLVLAVIMFAMVLFMYFISFIFGYYLVETRALTPPKIRIAVEEMERAGFFKRFIAKLKGST